MRLIIIAYTIKLCEKCILYNYQIVSYSEMTSIGILDLCKYLLVFGQSREQKQILSNSKRFS